MHNKADYSYMDALTPKPPPTSGVPGPTPVSETTPTLTSQPWVFCPRSIAEALSQCWEWEGA